MKHIALAATAVILILFVSCDENKHLIDYNYYLKIFGDMPEVLKPDPDEITSRNYFVVGDSVRVLNLIVQPTTAEVVWLLDGNEIQKGIKLRYKTETVGNHELVCRARYLDLERTDTTRLVVMEKQQ